MFFLCVFFFFERYSAHRDLHVLTHSFPTPRSSDLASGWSRTPPSRPRPGACRTPAWSGSRTPSTRSCVSARRYGDRSGRRSTIFSPPPAVDAVKRSEEHTSELQSLMRISYSVFCLKKKKNAKTYTTERTN